MSFKRTILLNILLIGALVVIASFWMYAKKDSAPPSISEQEPGFDTINPDEPLGEPFIHPRLQGLDDWQRPGGPWRVALQVGHWKASEAPDELENLRFTTGTSYAGTTEWELALAIAEKTKEILEAAGISVEILPTTIPPNYFADVFISIHADGNTNPSVSGYKVAAPRRDYTGKAEGFALLLEREYGMATNLSLDNNITRTMQGYYAFNWRKYNHSLHPMTVAAIMETGFLTNTGDRRIIVNTPEKPASGIANGILKYLGVTAKTAQGVNLMREE